VAHKDSIRTFLAIVNHLDLELHQVDIKAAFLNGDLDKTIYMEPPEGLEIDSTSVIRLKKSLYGLKQAPRCFNQKLDTWLKSQGLHPTKSDACIYHKYQDGIILLISIHVDDQLLACNNKEYLQEFKMKLNKEFECSDSGNANYFLGFNILRDRRKRELQICQHHYINTILSKFKMEDCNPTSTPFPAGFKAIIATDSEHQEAEGLPYPQLAGSLLYLATISRPDIAQAATTLCRFIGKWNKVHFAAAKHLLRYLKGTIDLSLTFRSKNQQLIGYSDADWGGDLNTRRSTTGYIFQLFGATIAWKSRLQSTVALSTTEAEYMATVDAAKQAMWLKQLLQELQFNFETITLHNDNNGCIGLSKNPINHEKTKHISMRHHFLRERVQDGVVTVKHVPSKQNIADILTKHIAKDQFQYLRDSMGLSLRGGVSQPSIR
jgi:hypothetical protein